MQWNGIYRRFTTTINSPVFIGKIKEKIQLGLKQELSEVLGNVNF